MLWLNVAKSAACTAPALLSLVTFILACRVSTWDDRITAAFEAIVLFVVFALAMHFAWEV